ncbi:efflux RND transporter periplasmic adaptor subunit [Gilvimarinus agarilyticus]|uniref:efflux RND transporter periplasmic adaptor subunit n=1 Tax=Gilvimarinus sp. 2_MG-2023 TaxID=3062666 RepID=UPI001C084238|nr:efflux RND transporter periplasmic adaptor subunit [Gilvimarinus sp. 2_MG-2023]MBU2887178.1 efflux RND transporter periplasmic adaptor subunit [Gilvimarinus agarilyticus]MDO6571837.1 efflux RND transporter periplasmic adaptor subunit [Gilvimarinus sp. 2_MG-2023]
MKDGLTPTKIIIPVAIVLLVAVIIVVLVNSKPTPGTRPQSDGPKISVETLPVHKSDIAPEVLSYGLVEPRTQTRLVSQVGGRVERISESFTDGSFFQKGDLLLQIEPTDYEIELSIAKATLAEAEQALAEEVARSEQARVDWDQLGGNVAARPLVLREPYMRAAEARVASSQALLKQAEVNLERTSIRAPYDGRVLSTSVDVGQVIANNTELGEIYATDAVEIRLPVKNQDLALLSLPEAYRTQAQSTEPLPKVSIRSELAQNEVWQGNIVRTAGKIDSSSRQLYVVARIEDPFGERSVGRFPLKIGQYVTAIIEGVTQEGVISIPNQSIYQGAYVYLYRDGAVFRTPVDIGWQNGDFAIITQGVEDGDQVVTSPLGQVVSGTLVSVSSGHSPAALGGESDLSMSKTKAGDSDRVPTAEPAGAAP